MKKLIAALLPFAGGCVSNSPYVPVVELGVAHEMHERVIGERGVNGVFRIRQPVFPGRAYLSFTHVSSLDGHDNGTLDQIEFFVQMPLALDR